MSTREKLLFYTYSIVVPVFSVYWLLANPLLLIAFFVAVGTWYLGQFFRFCTRCRVEQYPFNRARPLLPAGSRRGRVARR